MIKLIKPRFWSKLTLFTLFLLPFSLLFQLVVLIRHQLLKPKSVGIPVICIGNAVIGGSGKTPLVIELAKFLQNKGKRVAIIARGYLGTLSNTLEVVQVTAKMSFDEVGDEALLLAKIAPTYINSNRFLAATKAKADGADIIIMDDGLQNYSIVKDFSLLVIDSFYGLGNGLVLPAGPLREPLPLTLTKSDAVVITGNRAFNIATTKPTFKAVLSINNQAQLTESGYIALVGIANPNKFFHTLNTLKLTVTEKFIFEDHHRYSEQELETIFALALKLNTKVITTSKDLVKIPNKYHHFLVAIEVSYSLPAAFYNLILDRLS